MPSRNIGIEEEVAKGEFEREKKFIVMNWRKIKTLHWMSKLI
jgi:hypothetical protein